MSSVRVLSTLLVLSFTAVAAAQSERATGSARQARSDQDALPAFPKADAKWAIRGHVVADSRIRNDRPLARRFSLLANEGKETPEERALRALLESSASVDVRPRARVAQNDADLSLPNVVVTVKGLEKRWSFPDQSKPALRVQVDSKAGFDRRVLVFESGNNIEFVKRDAASEFTIKIHRAGTTGVLPLLPGPTTRLISEPRAGRSDLFVAIGPRRIPLGHVELEDTLALTGSRGRNDFLLLYVTGHPVHCVSDRNGRFALPKLPDGNYEIVAIHEVLGTQSMKIKIAGKLSAPVKFTFKVPEELQPKSKR